MCLPHFAEHAARFWVLTSFDFITSRMASELLLPLAKVRNTTLNAASLERQFWLSFHPNSALFLLLLPPGLQPVYLKLAGPTNSAGASLVILPNTRPHPGDHFISFQYFADGERDALVESWFNLQWW
jgi:hypothetical protein